MLKIALVGVGSMGKGHLNEYLHSKMPDGQLIAVCDIRPDVAKEAVKGTDLKVYDDMEKMIAAEKPDIVDIVTPTYTHAALAIRAMELGCHVLSEKPMALNEKQADEMIAASERTGKKLMAAHVVRFMAPYKFLAEAIRSERLGKLLRLDMKRLSGLPRWSWQNWFLDSERSGGMLLDLSIHDLDFVLSTLGEPTSSSCIHRRMENETEYSLTTMNYPGMTVTVEGAWFKADFPFSATYLAVFENGYIRCDGNVVENGKEIAMDLAVPPSEGSTKESGGSAYGDEIRYFTSCVKNGTNPDFCSPESSRDSVSYCNALIGLPAIND